MIEVTLKTIVMSQEALKELTGFKPVGKFGYHAARLVAQCTDALASFETARQNSIEAHGEYNDKNANYIFPTEAAQKAVNKEIADLLSATVTLQADLLLFDELEKLTPTVGLISSLNWAIAPPA